MILIHKDIFNPIKFDEENINILILENKIFFINKVNEIIDQVDNNNGNFILMTEKGEELNFSKNCNVVTDLFCLNFDSKKIKTVILNELKNIASSENYFTKIKNLEENIRELMLEIIYNCDYELELTEEFDISKLFKIYDISISKNYSNMVEKFISYVDILTDVLKIKLVFCVNILNFFEEVDRIEIYKYILAKKKNVIFIENNYSYEKIEYEKKYIIDKDFCEIYK